MQAISGHRRDTTFRRPTLSINKTGAFLRTEAVGGLQSVQDGLVSHERLDARSSDTCPTQLVRLFDCIVSAVRDRAQRCPREQWT